MHLSACPACDGRRLRTRTTSPFPVQRCDECGLLFRNPQPEVWQDATGDGDAFTRVRQPLAFLEEAHRRLAPGGVIRVAVPKRVRLTADRLHYFDRFTLGNVLARAGFRDVALSHDADAIVATGRAYPRRERPLLSIIFPAYNEVKTIRATLDRVVAKQVEGIDKEIIIVESNSTDGTREAALSYQNTPGVRVVLGDRPRGKGNAVRQGLTHASGDFVLIQDADDEYDINDYDALLEPLRRYQRAVVLGTRHKGHWRIRNFGATGSVTAYMNLGHIVLTEFFNLLYGQTLTDPWTMYKVFRRDCIYRLRLECNRFDFDVELVAKLVRRGYSPFEIPVHYHSRSFSEGKKIRVLRDPITWIWACLKYRVAPLDTPQ